MAFPPGDVPVLTEFPPTDDHQPQGNFFGYLLEEDNAMKAKMSGIFVSDLDSPQREMKVWFQNPEKEQRGVRYPFATIEFTNQSIAHSREHRGIVPISYKYLQDTLLDANQTHMMAYPIPMDLEWTIITHARSNQHHTQIIAALTDITRLHPRFAYLECSGGTIRRLEVLASTPSVGRDKDDLRIFRMIYKVRVPTEIESTIVMGSRVQNVVISLVDTVSGVTNE